MSMRGNNTVFTSSSLAPGTQLNGTYEIGDLISSGGMGEVYRGHNIATGDPVAIKVVLPEFAADQFILDLFRKEARILDRLTHEAIVRYYGFASDRTLNRSYMAMEFVDGPSLAYQMKQAPLNVEEVSGLRIRLADGLQRAHEAGVIHRDISPENVILQGGQVSRAKIIDFGIAKSTAMTAEGGTLIGTTFAGRYNYASPEQVGMFRPAGVSPRSDIYSLGLVLAAAVLGSPIDMSGTMAEIMEKRMVVPDLSGIPPGMRELLTSMLQPNPEDRIGSMAEVRDWTLADATGMTAAQGVGFGRTPSSATGSSSARSASSKRPIQPRAASKSPPRLQTTSARAAPPMEQSRGKPGLWIGIILLVVILLGAAGGWYYVKSKTGAWQQAEAPQPDGPTAPAVPETGKIPEAPAEPTPAPPPQQPPAATAPKQMSAASLRAFLSGYDGGDCFYAWSSDDEPGTPDFRILGLGSDQEAFSGLLEKLKRETGTDWQIVTQLIRPQQCPAVSALKSLMRGKQVIPTLQVKSQNIFAGDKMEGEAFDYRGTYLDLLYVQQEGFTYKLTNIVDLKKKTFSLSVGAPNLPKGSPGIPQLLLLVASSQPLQSLAQLSEKNPRPASEVFPELVKEAESNGTVSVAVKYLQLKPPGG